MISRFLSCLGGAALVLAATGAVAQEKWNLPTAYPEANYHTKMIREFAEDVKAATGGKLEIVVHSNASLFKMPEIKRAVQSEQVQIGEMLWNAYGNEDPLFEADAVPFLANSVPLARKLWDAAKPLIEERLKKQNLMVLYSAPWPPQGIYSKTPITACGLSRRVMAESSFSVVSTTCPPCASVAAMVRPNCASPLAARS